MTDCSARFVPGVEFENRDVHANLVAVSTPRRNQYKSTTENGGLKPRAKDRLASRLREALRFFFLPKMPRHHPNFFRCFGETRESEYKVAQDGANKCMNISNNQPYRWQLAWPFVGEPRRSMRCLAGKHMPHSRTEQKECERVMMSKT